MAYWWLDPTREEIAAVLDDLKIHDEEIRKWFLTCYVTGLLAQYKDDRYIEIYCTFPSAHYDSLGMDSPYFNQDKLPKAALVEVANGGKVYRIPPTVGHHSSVTSRLDFLQHLQAKGAKITSMSLADFDRKREEYTEKQRLAEVKEQALKGMHHLYTAKDGTKLIALCNAEALVYAGHKLLNCLRTSPHEQRFRMSGVINYIATHYDGRIQSLAEVYCIDDTPGIGSQAQSGRYVVRSSHSGVSNARPSERAIDALAEWMAPQQRIKPNLADLLRVWYAWRMVNGRPAVVEITREDRRALPAVAWAMRVIRGQPLLPTRLGQPEPVIAIASYQDSMTQFTDRYISSIRGHYARWANMLYSEAFDRTRGIVFDSLSLTGCERYQPQTNQAQKRDPRVSKGRNVANELAYRFGARKTTLEKPEQPKFVSPVQLPQVHLPAPNVYVEHDRAYLLHLSRKVNTECVASAPVHPALVRRGDPNWVIYDEVALPDRMGFNRIINPDMMVMVRTPVAARTPRDRSVFHMSLEYDAARGQRDLERLRRVYTTVSAEQ